MSNATGCTATATGTVTVNPAPTPTLSSTAICAGQTATLTATGGTSYTLVNTGAVNTTGIFQVNPSQYHHLHRPGEQCHGLHRHGYSTVTVDAGFFTCTAVPVQLAGSTTICAGQSATLIASGANSYVFSAAGATGNTLMVQPVATTVYSVTGLDGFGCSSIASATVVVNPLPVATLTSATICTGATATLTATGGTSYTLLNTGTVNTTGIFPVSPTATTSYTVRVGNATGCTTTSSSTVTVNPLPTVSVTSLSIAQGQSTTLVATGCNGTVSWNTGQTGASLVVSPSATTSYTATCTTQAGCSATAVATVTVTPVTLIDLSLTKIVSNPVAQVGSTVTFTLVVSNAGPSTATGVEVSDAIPSGFSYVANSATGGLSRTAVGNTLTWTIGSLAAGANTSLTFQATVSATGVYTNVAQVSKADQPDVDSSPGNLNGLPAEDDEAAATVTPGALIDLSLTKTVSNSVAQVGSTVTFTLVVSNAGPSTATGVEVSDVVPSGFTYVANTATGGTSRNLSGATLTWAISNIAPGANTTLSFQAVVNASGNYTNLAQVSKADQPDPDSQPGNLGNTPVEDDEAAATVVPRPLIDLSLIKTVSSTTPVIGSTVSFSIVVSNAGPSGATGVAVSDVVPSGFSYLANSATGGVSRTAVGNSVSWTIGSLATGANTTLSFQAVVNASGNYTNLAQVSQANELDVDSRPGNLGNVPAEDDESAVTVTPIVPGVITVTSATICAGQSATLVATGCNGTVSWNTTQSGSSIVVSPSVTTSYTATCSVNGVTSLGVGTVTVNPVPTISVNSLTVTQGQGASLVATGCSGSVYWLTGDAGSNILVVCTATTSFTAVCVTSAGCSASAVATVTVIPIQADLSLTKLVSNTTPQVGSTVTFTLVVSNAGPSTATGVEVRDVLPSGYSYVANSIAGGTSQSVAGSALTWAISSMAPGANTTLSFQAVVNASGNYTNLAQVSKADQPDPDSQPGNLGNTPVEDDEAAATVVPRPLIDLSLIKTVSNTTPVIGSTVTFTIVVSNAGPSGATGVAVSDVIPSGFSYVANSATGGVSRTAVGNTLSWTIGSLASGCQHHA